MYPHKTVVLEKKNTIAESLYTLGNFITKDEAFLPDFPSIGFQHDKKQ